MYDTRITQVDRLAKRSPNHKGTTEAKKRPTVECPIRNRVAPICIEYSTSTEVSEIDSPNYARDHSGRAS